jgi:hypothetical protein
VLGRLETDELFYLVAEVGKKVVAFSEINKRTGYEKHAGVEPAKADNTARMHKTANIKILWLPIINTEKGEKE